MRKSGFRAFGILLIIIGLFLVVNSLPGITGFVVVEEVSGTFGPVIGVVFFIFGILLVINSLEKKAKKVISQIDQALNSGAIGSYRDARRMAKKIGYELEEGSNHTNVYDRSHHLITEIPRHASEVATGTYRSILKNL